MKDLLSTNEAAEHLGVTDTTMRRWRSQGVGPAFTKIGAFAAYTVADLDAWVKDGRKVTANQGLPEKIAPAVEQFSRAIDADTAKDHARANALLITAFTHMYDAVREAHPAIPSLWESIEPKEEPTSAYADPDYKSIYDL